MRQEQLTALNEKIKKEYTNIAGIIVLKEGQTVYEHYFNGCTADNTIHVFSATKSILSLLIGIALDKGYIKDVEQKVLDFFPDYSVSDETDVVKEITLKDLLTMTAPYKHQEEPYIEYFTSSHYAEFALNLLGGQEKTGAFRYTPIVGPDILSGILTKAIGKSVLDFANDVLFKPLNIQVAASLTFQNQEEQFAFYESTTTSGWVADAAGINTAGWGLTLTTRDMAKIGQLCLNEGLWEGKQLVSADWIKDSTRVHSCWEELGLNYGYLWWILNPEKNCFAAMGDAGNVIYVNGKKKLVISIASLNMQEAKDRLELITQVIEPLLDV